MTASSSRSIWLDWQPQQELLEELPNSEPPKPPKPNFEGFGGSILGCSPTFSVLPNPEKWVRDFHFWVLARCRFVDRWWSSVAHLHADFCAWNVTRDCDAATFRGLLDSAGFFVEEVRGTVWCYGLVLARLLLPDVAEARRPQRLEER